MIPAVIAAWTLMGVMQSLGVAPTNQEIAACRRSVIRLCGHLLPKDGSTPSAMGVLACLKTNRARISPACRAVLERHGQ